MEEKKIIIPEKQLREMLDPYIDEETVTQEFVEEFISNCVENGYVSPDEDLLLKDLYGDEEYIDEEDE